MTLRRCNQLIDWLEQGYQLSPQDLAALLRDALYAHKRLIKARMMKGKS